MGTGSSLIAFRWTRATAPARTACTRLIHLPAGSGGQLLGDGQRVGSQVREAERCRALLRHYGAVARPTSGERTSGCGRRRRFRRGALLLADDPVAALMEPTTRPPRTTAAPPVSPSPARYQLH